jgi:hypothetical protein
MYPPGVQQAGVFVGAQRAAPFLIKTTGRLDPHPLLGAARYRLLQESDIRWAHPRAIVDKDKKRKSHCERSEAISARGTPNLFILEGL